MAASTRDDEFDEYDKPGAERSRRRRGTEEEMDSDLEGDLLEEDWLSSKKNPSELSDEELNDDLLQSDEEDQENSGTVVSLNATLGLSSSYVLQGDDTEEGYEAAVGVEGGEEDYNAGEFADEEGGTMEEGMEYSTGQNEETYEDEVLELDINEPLDDEFQVGDYGAEPQEEQSDQQEVPEVDVREPEEDVVGGVGEDRDGSQVTESEEMEPDVEPEAEQEADIREESDEDEEDQEESGRLRFKTERKDVTVVRLADAASKRRNIPETLELTEEAKADLLEFEEKERQKKQGRFRGRGGGGRGRGGGGRGGPSMFRSGDFRHNGGSGRGKINEQRPPLMQMNLGLQPRLTQHHHASRPSGPRGAPGLFPNPLAPLSQQPLQMLMHTRSPGPPPKPHQELHGPRGLATPPPPAHGHAHSNLQHQPKNIHINPHFRGPSSSSAGQVPLMSPVQNQPRPNVSPQRFPGPVEFQPHLQGNFGQPQRPPPPPEPWRGPPPHHHHQEREPFFVGEPRFPGQHMFDLPGPPPLMNNILPLAGQGPLSFPQPGGLSGPSGPGPGFGPLGIGQGQGPPGAGGLFQSLPPQHSGPPTSPGPRGFMGHRQPFPPQQQQQQGGPPFSPQHMPFGMQGLMQPHSQLQHLDPPPSHHSLHHHQQQHRQDLPPQGHPQSHQLHPPNQQQHHHHHQRQPGEQHPIMHHSQFRQPLQGGPRQTQPRPQNNQQRNNIGRMRMSSPPALQQLHSPPHRNSNLRELPIATGNADRPLQHAGHARPVVRPQQDARPGQSVAGGAAGRGRGAAKMQPPPPSAATVKKEEPAAHPSTVVPDPDEDEETRQYRLKIEEQKRLREEILKRKELRRQMQAGARKKELMERQAQAQVQTQAQAAATHPGPQLQPPLQALQQVPSLASNGVPQTPTPGPGVPRINSKPRLPSASSEPQTSGQQAQQQQRRAPNQPNPQRQTAPFQNPQSGPRGPAEAQLQALRPGGKRTVMQRTNNTASPQIPQKVRMVKRLGEPAPNLSTPPQSQQQQQQQQPPPQQPPPIGRPGAQQRLGGTRKVMVASDGAHQQQETSGMPNEVNRVVVPVRGRGRGGVTGRGGGRILMQQGRQNPRADEPQTCTVSIGGLSSNTTEKQIKNLLNSIGPIQMLKMIPQQRKAIAKFTNPQHALSFQHSFHRHMIDLSNIDVTLVDD